MKVSWQEVRAFEDFIQRLEDETEKTYVFPDTHPLAGEIKYWDYYAERPHLLMVMGFDEYVAFRNKREFQDSWFVDDLEDCGHSIYRKPSGQWYVLYNVPPGYRAPLNTFCFHSKRTLKRANEHDDDEGFALTFPVREVFKRLYKAAECVIEDEKTLWTPTLWTPGHQGQQALVLQSTRGILAALKAEKVSLDTVPWRQLEEIVAEILRANGLEIHIVRESPQGGRDIIARGELIIGQEPILMAVEVKQRKVVDRPEVQKALWQNRHFPALLFVTSGVFTAGVIREKSLPDNRLRLFLKDGEALGDMIRDYRFR